MQDQEVVTAQQALQVAQTNLDHARLRYNDAAAKYDQTNVNAPGADLDPTVVKAAGDVFQQAQIALSKAESDYATSSRGLSTASGNAAARTQSPETKKQLEAQARNYDAQAKLSEANAAVIGAKSDTELKAAQANLLNAQANAARTSAEIKDLLPAQAANLNASAQQSRASAGEANARSSVLIPAQAASANAAAAASNAQAAQTQAQTDQLLPAQVNQANAQANSLNAGADLSKSQAGNADATAANTRAQTEHQIPAQVKQALSAAGLNDAQAAAVWQKIKQPQQITQGLDNPNLVFQDPETGKPVSQRNPAYEAANSRLLQNQYDTISQVQGMIEKGQMSPLEGQTYMDALRTQTSSALRGTTPFAETQQRQNYLRDAGGVGRDILNTRISQGSSLANSLLEGVGNIGSKINVPFDFSGFNPLAQAKQFINELGGGQQTGDAAAQLVQALLAGVNQGGQPQQQAAPQQQPMANNPPGANLIPTHLPGVFQVAGT